MADVFPQSQLQAVTDALGDTSAGSEIAHLLATCAIKDTDPEHTKRHRLYNAFAHDQNTRQDRTRILGFIRKALKPERFAREPQRFEPMRTNLNRALAFAGPCCERCRDAWPDRTGQDPFRCRTSRPRTPS